MHVAIGTQNTYMYMGHKCITGSKTNFAEAMLADQKHSCTVSIICNKNQEHICNTFPCKLLTQRFTNSVRMVLKLSKIKKGTDTVLVQRSASTVVH